MKPGHRLVLFGEMVALLWAEGRREATIRLEELCRDLVERYGLHLLCAYPIRAFDPAKYHRDFSNICEDHTQVNAVAALRLAALCRITMRRLARLQQKTKAQKVEIQFSRRRMQALQQEGHPLQGTVPNPPRRRNPDHRNAVPDLLGTETSGNARRLY